MGPVGHGVGLCVLYLGVGKDAPGQGWECASWRGAPALVCLSGSEATQRRSLPLQLYLEQLAKGPADG